MSHELDRMIGEFFPTPKYTKGLVYYIGNDNCVAVIPDGIFDNYLLSIPGNVSYWDDRNILCLWEGEHSTWSGILPIDSNVFKRGPNRELFDQRASADYLSYRFGDLVTGTSHGYDRDLALCLSSVGAGDDPLDIIFSKCPYEETGYMIESDWRDISGRPAKADGIGFGSRFRNTFCTAIMRKTDAKLHT